MDPAVTPHHPLLKTNSSAFLIHEFSRVVGCRCRIDRRIDRRIDPVFDVLLLVNEDAALLLSVGLTRLTLALRHGDTAKKTDR